MEKSQKTAVNIQTELSRDLGMTSALAIGVGTMIAAGIFTLSGLAIRNVGSAAILSFLLAAVIATFTALTYCEFVSIYPESGGGYLYARKTFPSLLAYFVGWTLTHRRANRNDIVTPSRTITNMIIFNCDDLGIIGVRGKRANETCDLIVFYKNDFIGFQNGYVVISTQVLVDCDRVGRMFAL